MKEKFIKIWKDPVGSKVIASVIIGLGILIYNAFFAYATNLNFLRALKLFWTISIPLWVVPIILGLIYIYNIRRSKKVKSQFSYDEKTLALDINLFNEIRNNIITIENIQWLRTNNFAGYSFPDNSLNPFDEIEIKSERADFEFLNPELEHLKNDFIYEIKNLSSFMLPNIFSSGQHRLTVPHEWELEQSERFWTAVDGIHSRAQSVARKYDQFIKEGRRLLKV